MKNKVKTVIEKLILKKYPYLLEAHVEDLFENTSLIMFQNQFHVTFKTSECLESEQMVEIEEEVKMLFSMLKVENNPFSFNTESIITFYDCGDGQGAIFIAPYGYKRSIKNI